MREIMERVEKQVELGDWDKERYEKSGYVRWESILHFFSIDCVKAGFLIKKKGIWYLTPEVLYTKVSHCLSAHSVEAPDQSS